MLKLVTILKILLTELADTSKSFSFNKIEDRIKEDPDSPYMTGAVYYRFKTGNKLVYEVQVQYLGGYDEVYDFAQAGDGQMVEANFYTDHPDEEGYDKNRFDTTNNPKELFRVMSIIVKCVKEAYDNHSFRYIIYQPVEHKGGGKSPKGSEQRTKLYDYYIKKEFPKSESKKEGNYIITTLE